MVRSERVVDIGDTGLNVAELGPADAYPIMILHGGPGLDHHMFGDYLDPLAGRGYRLVFVDERAQGRSLPAPPETWTLARMAADVPALARALGIGPYALLGHSYGAFVALQAAVDHPGAGAQTIISSGVPSARFLEQVWANLDAFEPVELREQVRASWEREKDVTTQEECEALWLDQLPFHFADPLDPRIAEYEARTTGAVHAPEVLRHFASADYGGIEVEDRLAGVRRPVLVLGGRADRACSVAGSEAIARGIDGAQLVVFERSAHMTFVEENDAYLDAVDRFLAAGR